MFDSFIIHRRYDRTILIIVYRRYFSNDNFIILLLYVDDILIISHNIKKIINLKMRVEQGFYYTRLKSD